MQVTNRYGDVRLRFGGYSSDMELLIITQNLDGALTVKTDSDAQQDHIEVVPVSDQTAPQKSRVDLVLMVPQGKDVVVTTGSGLVEAKGIHGAVSVTTDSGRVRFNKNKAAVSATTDSGDIAAVLKKDATETEQRFISTTGQVEVWVAEDDAITASLETSADLITHFSLTVERNPHQEPDKKATATINGGGNRLVLKSRRGNVAVRSYPASQ